MSSFGRALNIIGKSSFLWTEQLDLQVCAQGRVSTKPKSRIKLEKGKICSSLVFHAEFKVKMWPSSASGHLRFCGAYLPNFFNHLYSMQVYQRSNNFWILTVKSVHTCMTANVKSVACTRNPVAFWTLRNSAMMASRKLITGCTLQTVTVHSKDGNKNQCSHGIAACESK